METTTRHTWDQVSTQVLLVRLIKNFATTNDFDDISLTPSLKLRVLNSESQRTDIGVEEIIKKTDVESSLNTSPISDVNRNFGTINGFDDISFTPSMRKYMVNIESNTSLIDKD